MATKKKTYTDDVDYAVKFAKVATYGRTTFRPKSSYPTVKGRVLNELPEEAIESAVPA